MTMHKGEGFRGQCAVEEMGFFLVITEDPAKDGSWTTKVMYRLEGRAVQYYERIHPTQSGFVDGAVGVSSFFK